MKILVATDGSKFGDKAVERCLEMVAADKGSEVRIVSVVEPFTSPAPDAFGVAIDYYREAEKAANESAEATVERARETLVAGAGEDTEIDVSTTVLRGRYPKNAIVEEAAEWEADLIVVGSHGYGFWDRMLLGSVSSAVVHHAPCSVLVVRSEE